MQNIKISNTYHLKKSQMKYALILNFLLKYFIFNNIFILSHRHMYPMCTGINNKI